MCARIEVSDLTIQISRPSPSPVSVVRVLNPKDEKEVMRHVSEAIDNIGGMRSIVKNGDSVFIKPNFAAPRPPDIGVTTSLAVIKEVINEVMDSGGKPVMGESPATRDFDPDIVYKLLGIREFAKKVGIEFVDVEKSEKVTVEVPGGVLFKKLKLPRIVAESDVLISIPKMKTHMFAKVSLGMKNLIGAIPIVERLRAHLSGLEQGIVDINKIVKQDLVVVDGTIAMEGNGPFEGDPVKLGVLVAGRDVLAVDSVCCQIMGIDPESVEYLRMAFEQIGRPEVEVIGETISDISHSFVIPDALRKGRNTLLVLVDNVFTKILGRPVTTLPFSLRLLGRMPEVDESKCNGCGSCRDACPVGAIEMERVAKINYAQCVRCMCLICIESCPTNAIEKRARLRLSQLFASPLITSL